MEWWRFRVGLEQWTWSGAPRLRGLKFGSRIRNILTPIRNRDVMCALGRFLNYQP